MPPKVSGRHFPSESSPLLAPTLPYTLLMALRYTSSMSIPSCDPSLTIFMLIGRVGEQERLSPTHDSSAVCLSACLFSAQYLPVWSLDTRTPPPPSEAFASDSDKRQTRVRRYFFFSPLWSLTYSPCRSIVSFLSLFQRLIHRVKRWAFPFSSPLI